MEQAQKSRFKIFLWDQLVRPIYLLLDIGWLNALFLAVLILNFVLWKSIITFWILVIGLASIYIYQLFKYYKSGEFMHNYRKFKSERGEYADYRKLTKELKKAEQEKVKPIILDNNPLSIAMDMEEHTDVANKLNAEENKQQEEI